MIVLKSTLAKVEAERDALVVRNEELAQSYLELDVHYVGVVAELRRELATTYVRDGKGRIRRHPSSITSEAEAQVAALADALADGAMDGISIGTRCITPDAPPAFEPSRPILDSALNKDRTGKHGSEVA